MSQRGGLRPTGILPDRKWWQNYIKRMSYVLKKCMEKGFLRII